MHSTGQCPVCERRVRLTDGRQLIRTHVTRGARCQGMGHEPVAGTVVHAPDGRDIRKVAAEPVTALDDETPEVRTERDGGPRAGGKVAVLLAAVLAVGIVLMYALADGSSSASATASSDTGVAASTDGTVSSPQTSASTEPPSSTPTQPPRTYTPPPPASVPSPATDNAYGLPNSVVEQTFLASVHDSGLSVYGPDDEQVQLARALCGALDRGAAFEDAMDVLMSTGYGSSAAGAYFGLAVASFCPEHSTW